MDNRSESLINVVTIEVPKLLLGTTQNGMWPDISLQFRDTSSRWPPAERRVLNQSCGDAGTW